LHKQLTPKRLRFIPHPDAAGTRADNLTIVSAALTSCHSGESPIACEPRLSDFVSKGPAKKFVPTAH
jgi:hypothetical protein